MENKTTLDELIGKFMLDTYKLQLKKEIEMKKQLLQMVNKLD